MQSYQDTSAVADLLLHVVYVFRSVIDLTMLNITSGRVLPRRMG